MARGWLQGVIRDLRTATVAEGIGGLTDGQLLERFVTRGDEASFELLVWRHGAMVLATCRRVLRDPADAEDAFQATFLVFLRRAGSIARREAVAGWLHKVALRSALRLRAKTTPITDTAADEPRTTNDPAEIAAGNEVRAILDEEVARLPKRQGAPFVLCYLEGKTTEEAARCLGCPRGTVLSRLSRARDRLRARLTRRGVALSAGVMAAAVSPEAAALPVPLVDATVKAAVQVAAGNGVAVVSATVLTVTEGVLTTMSRTTRQFLAAALIGCGLVAAGVAALAHRAANEPAPRRPENPAKTDAGRAEVPDIGDQRATRLGRAAHAQAAALEKLPRFDYQVRYRYAVVDSMRAVADVKLDRLRSALTTPVREQDWFGYELGLSWDEKRLIWEARPGQSKLNYSYRFGTATDAWDRAENKEKTSVQFTRRAAVDEYWADPDSGGGSYMNLFEVSYLRVTTHRYWWGRTVKRSTHQMVAPSVDEMSWKYAGVEQFGGEECEILDSTAGGDPCQRLWVSRASGRLRGVLAYLDGKEPNELAQFDDYREVAKGVWLPFREVRTHGWASDKPGKQSIVRSELAVLEARTGVDLAERYARLLPREGDAVQDQRFAAAVNLAHSDKRTDDEVRTLADAEYKKQFQGQEEFKRIVKPLDALVGKPAPALPAEGWVGGKRPDVAGKPYLVHFWATWCGPCKADLPQLAALVEKGFTVVGMHPAGTQAEDVEKIIRDQKLGYPTLLAADKDGDTNRPTIGGYPAGVFPYCVLVDAQGRVASHGPLSEMLGAVAAEVRLKELAGKPAPALDVGRWLNTPEDLSLDKLKGKVVLLDFWGQWCNPCVEKLPRVEELHAKFKDRGLVVIGVHTTRQSDNLDEFLKARKVSFSVAIDRGETATRYGVESWPTYLLIDRAGKVVWGFSNEPPTADRIEQLLGK